MSMPFSELDVRDRLIAAADMTTSEAFDAWLDIVGPHVNIVKIGMALATSLEGGVREAVRRIRKRFPQVRIMYDPKFYEIPANMVIAMQQLCELEGVWGITVHASAGAGAIQKLRAVKGGALLIGVTVLTTTSEAECERVYGTSVAKTVLRLADEALNGGVDAIVCAPMEIGLLRDKQRFNQVEIITPNVRPAWALVPGDDQNTARQMTPRDALKIGATRVVIGRPLVGTFSAASGPAETVPLILAEMSEALTQLDG